MDNNGTDGEANATPNHSLTVELVRKSYCLMEPASRSGAACGSGSKRQKRFRIGSLGVVLVAAPSVPTGGARECEAHRPHHHHTHNRAFTNGMAAKGKWQEARGKWEGVSGER